MVISGNWIIPAVPELLQFPVCSGGEMSKHTPGPWKWMRNETEPGLDGDSPLVSESGESILQLGDCYQNGGEPNAANANLIAAAPDLLEALELLLVDAENLDGNLESEFGSSKRKWESPYTFDIARAAIARAKGEK
jgi:hypothetical protein